MTFSTIHIATEISALSEVPPAPRNPKAQVVSVLLSLIIEYLFQELVSVIVATLPPHLSCMAGVPVLALIQIDETL